MRKSWSRRRLLMGAMIAVPCATALRPARVRAEQSLVPLDPGDPTARALGYVEDASNVDTAKYPRKQPGQTCANCNLYTGVDAEQGACTIFRGKLVKAAGWCNSWIPKG